jgi:ribosomal 50S subunit-associated protein YjgA (DUF615 family)
LVRKRRFTAENEISSEEAERPSRAERKRANRLAEEALARLSTELVGLNDKGLLSLALPDDVLEAVREAQAMRTAAARNRQVGKVRALLRDAQWPTVARRVSTLLLTGHAPAPSAEGRPAALERDVAEWVMRLLHDGTSALDALVAARPAADRAHLAELVQKVRRAPRGRRNRAEERLALAVRGCLPR